MKRKTKKIAKKKAERKTTPEKDPALQFKLRRKPLKPIRKEFEFHNYLDDEERIPLRGDAFEYIITKAVQHMLTHYPWIAHDYTREELLAKDWFLRLEHDYDMISPKLCLMLLESKESHEIEMENYKERLKIFNAWKRDHKSDIDAYIKAKKGKELEILEIKKQKDLKEASQALQRSQAKIIKLHKELGITE